MNSTRFTWQHLDWKKFQEVSLHLYSKVYNDPGVEEFLKQGNFQAGIDLISFDPETGKYNCAQCKHEKLTLSKLKKIVDLFLSGGFAQKSKRFILTTTSDLQKKAIQEWVLEQQHFFSTQYQLAFEVWDRHRLSTLLKHEYHFVRFYWGPEIARNYCFIPSFEPPAYQAYPEFIERRVQAAGQQIQTPEWKGPEVPQNTLTLSDLLTKCNGARGICLLGEAYEGKTILFKQTAWELKAAQQNLVPLLLELKNCSVTPIAKLLDVHYPSWMTVPAKDLVIMIDGLDEVPAESFQTVVANLRDFTREHAGVRFICSCRKLFYAHNGLAAELNDFDFFELLELHMGQIFACLDELLGNRESSMNFYTEIYNSGLANLLHLPFYLVQLVRWFRQESKQMPRNKLEIALRFIQESLQLSADRKVRAGRKLKQVQALYRTILLRLGLLLQVKGVNALEYKTIQSFFTADEIDLMAQSTILHNNGENWSFINAFFQEQLTALALLQVPITTVIELSTVGEKIRKFSRKWLQPIATYLSLLAEQDPRRQQLIEVIEKDNIELLALAEGKKFDAAFRLQVLQCILRQAQFMRARLIVIDEADLAEFCGNDDAILDELLAVLNGDYNLSVKIVAAHTLQHLELTPNQGQKFAVVARKLTLEIDAPYLVRLLLESLTFHGLVDSEFLDRLLLRIDLFNHHEARQGFYKIMEKQGLVDQYYDFALDGLYVLHLHNQGTDHHGSERRLVRILAMTRSSKNLRRLLAYTRTPDVQELFAYRSRQLNELYKGIAQCCIRIQLHDPLIFIPVTDFLIFNGRPGREEKEWPLVDFLDATDSHARSLSLVIQRGEEAISDYVFCHGALNTKCFDTILYALEDHEIDRSTFNRLVNGLYHSDRSAAEQLDHLGESLFGFSYTPTAQAQRYHQASQQKKENNRKYIATREAFQKGVEAFFEYFGRETITLTDLDEREHEERPMAAIDSGLVYSFLYEHADKGLVNLSDCKITLQNDQLFNVWRADRLLKGNMDESQNEFARELLKAYYDKTVTLFPFPSIDAASDFIDRKQAVQLVKIWQKYHFPTPDTILLEFIRMNAEGYNAIKHLEVNKQVAFVKQMLDHFKNRPELIKEKVLQNLSMELTDESVVGTQFEFCRALNIRAAAPLLLKRLLEREGHWYHEQRYLDLYLSLGGDGRNLLPLFEKDDHYLLMHLAKLLEQIAPKEVEATLLKYLRDTTDADGRQIEAARRLAQLGNQEGFTYLIDRIVPGTQTPFDIQGNFKIWNVDTSWGLSKMERLISVLCDAPDAELAFYHNPLNLTLEILAGFASKSERDLQAVTYLLFAKRTEFQGKYPNTAGHLAWHAEQFKENFRKKEPEGMDNKAIKKILQEIETEV